MLLWLLNLAGAAGPFRTAAGQLWQTGAAAAELFTAGPATGQSFNSGQIAGQINGGCD